MQIRNEWKQTVSRGQLFFTLLFVLLLLGGLVFVSPQTGHKPPFSPVFYGVGLAAGWIITLVNLFRYGKQALGVARVLYLAGLTLFFGSSLLVSSPIAPDTNVLMWAKSTGEWLLLGGV